MAVKLPAKVKRQHFDFVASLGCLACGDAATIHHVTGYADRMGRTTKRDDRVVPLCPVHHQKVFDPSARYPVSVEGLGHRGFYQEHGIDLMAHAERLWAESEAA